MNNNLFIITDDLGLDVSVNDGITSALKNGWVDGASLMANGEAFDDAIERLKELKNPNIGIHFVLIEEKPIVVERLEKNHKSFFIKYVLGQIDLVDIERELRAQLSRCYASGVKPVFINSHQHLHLLPQITDIVIKLAKENHIGYIRTVTEPFSLRAGLFRGLESVFLVFLSKIARYKIKKAELKTNNVFVGFLHAGNLQKVDVTQAQKISENFKDKVVELGCHIGYENDELRKKYNNWGNYNWQKELEIIKTVKK